jgi:hypothetical protein
MRKEYDFSAAKKNPYAAQLKKQITIRLDEEAIEYFKAIIRGGRYSLSEPDQSLPSRLRCLAQKARSQMEVSIDRCRQGLPLRTDF